MSNLAIVGALLVFLSGLLIGAGHFLFPSTYFGKFPLFWLAHNILLLSGLILVLVDVVARLITPKNVMTTIILTKLGCCNVNRIA
jgi:hypothetical protein